MMLKKGITLNEDKCVFKKKEIIFILCDLEFQEIVIKPLESKVEAVEKFKIPKIAKKINSFLGLVHRCAAFIPNLTTIS